jgi:PmbA protein
MKERLGEQLFDARLTLWDDPTISARPRSSSHDQEGVPCRRKALIHQGTCAEFLYDLRTAAMMETQSTGNGARGLFSTPSPSPSNLIFQEGDQPLREMLAGIEHGLLVESLLGLGQGNAISGAFSNAIGLGYLIDHGEITGRVKNVSIAGNIYENLREIGAISQENYWVRGMLRMPYILLPDMKVVGEE